MQYGVHFICVIYWTFRLEGQVTQQVLNWEIPFSQGLVCKTPMYGWIESHPFGTAILPQIFSAKLSPQIRTQAGGAGDHIIRPLLIEFSGMTESSAWDKLSSNQSHHTKMESHCDSKLCNICALAYVWISCRSNPEIVSSTNELTYHEIDD